MNNLNEQSKISEAYLTRCRLHLATEFERLLFIQPQHQASAEVFKAYLEEAELSSERIENILEIYRRVEQHKKMKELLLNIEIFLQKDFKNKNGAELYRITKEFRDSLEQFPDGHFKKLAQVVLAIKAQNQAWAMSLLLEFFNQHHARVGFDLYRQIFDDEWTIERHHKLILNLALEITQYFKVKRPEEMDIFMTIQEQIIEARLFSSLSQSFGTDWSLARLRESVAKGERARQFPTFWFSQLSYRTSSSQTDQFLRNLFQNSKRYPLSPESLWIFAENFPRHEKEREHLSEIALKFYQDDFYYQYLILELLDHEPFKKLLENRDQRFTRPTFQLKRQYLRLGLESFRAPEWMLFELIKIGDFQRDYLWYLGLHPNLKKQVSQPISP